MELAVTIVHQDGRSEAGTLTTDHAASSFGIPVAVAKATGTAYGSAEIRGVRVEGAEAEAAAKRAGYAVLGSE